MAIPSWLLLTLAVLGLVSIGTWAARFPSYWWPQPHAKDIQIKLLTQQVESLTSNLSTQRKSYEERLTAEEARTRQETQTADKLRIELSNFQEKLLAKLMK